MHDNTTALSDEFIAHRLGLVPLRVTKERYPEDVFIRPRECSCTGHCPKCSVQFTLDVYNDPDRGIDILNVYSSHLITKSTDCEVVNYASSEEMEMEKEDGKKGILLIKLGPGQRISLNAIATLGFGKIHSKWSPVCVATFARDPIVTLNTARLDEISETQRIDFVKSCPTNVFSFDDRAKKVSVTKQEACMFCDECVKIGRTFRKQADDDNVVTIQAKPNRFIFSVETNGSLRPEQVVLSAIKSIQKMLTNVSDGIRDATAYDKVETTTDATYQEELRRYTFVDQGGFI